MHWKYPEISRGAPIQIQVVPPLYIISRVYRHIHLHYNAMNISCHCKLVATFIAMYHHVPGPCNAVSYICTPEKSRIHESMYRLVSPCTIMYRAHVTTYDTALHGSDTWRYKPVHNFMNSSLFGGIYMTQYYIGPIHGDRR